MRPGIREALFFLVTNILIIFGSTTFDYVFSIICAFPSQYPELSPTPSLATAFAAFKMAFDSGFVLSPADNQQELANVHIENSAFSRDIVRLRSILDAVERIRGKSRSFWIASVAFEGRLKVDLILL